MKRKYRHSAIKKDSVFFITFTSKEEAGQAMKQFKREFPVKSLTEDCFSELPKIVDAVRKGIVEEIIDPLGELLQEAIDEFDQREAKKQRPPGDWKRHRNKRRSSRNNWRK